MIIIELTSPYYQLWKIFVVIFCIISSYIYAFIAAFAIPTKVVYPELYYIDLFLEAIFVIDMLVRKYLLLLILHRVPARIQT